MVLSSEAGALQISLRCAWSNHGKKIFFIFGVKCQIDSYFLHVFMNLLY
jgi:hypothetical protein